MSSLPQAIQDLLSNTPSFLVIIDTSNNIVDASDAIASAYNVTRDFMKGLSVTAFTHPQDLPQSLDCLKRVLDRQFRGTFRNRNILPTGQVFSLLWSIVGYVGDNVMIVGNDLTLEIEIHLSAQASDLGETALSMAGIGCWEFQPPDSLSWDIRSYQIMGANPDVFTPNVGEFWDFVVTKDVDRVRSAFERSITENILFDQQFIIKRVDNSELRVVRSLSKNELNDDGSLRRVIGLFRDVTSEVLASEKLEDTVRKQTNLLNDLAETEKHLRRTLEELEEEKKQAEAEAKNKAMLLATLSHELRQPLNSIIGLISILQERTDPDSTFRTIRMLGDASKVLLLLINDILDVSKLESLSGSNKIQLDASEFWISEVLDSVIMLNAPNCGAGKDVELVSYLDPSAMVPLLGDRNKIHQIVMNLVSNAVKFTARGYVSLSCIVKESTSEYLVLHISVEDTGMGIDEETRRHLFVPFVQSKVASRKFVGSGLGLSIASGFARLMNTEIHVESALNKGSTFSFDLRLLLVVPDSKPLAPLPRSCFLLMKDCHEKTGLLKQLLALNAHVVELSPKDFDLGPASPIINEIMKSRMNILFVHYPYLPVVTPTLQVHSARGLTAFLLSYNEESKDLHLFSGTLTLPYQHRDICSILTSLEHVQKPVHSIQENSLRRPLNTDCFKVLAADDDATNRQVLSMILKSLHVEPTMVEDGMKAVDKYTSDPNLYDLLLLDFRMPVMSGIDAAKAIRAYESEHCLLKVPIIILSGDITQQSKLDFLSSEVNHWLVKPYSKSDLVNVLDRWLPLVSLVSKSIGYCSLEESKD
ncbi:hypothetical protein RCL1_006215 [Eukaryota sp. TZLM3-RCL]